MSFRSLYSHGFARVAACTTQCTLGDPGANAQAVLELARRADGQAVAVAVFSELVLSGYSIGDLLFQDALLDAVEAAVGTLLLASEKLMPLLVVGAPLRHAGRLYNCALAIHRGRLLGVVPKVYLPNYHEFYERRHFASGAGTEGQLIRVGGHGAAFGPDLLFAVEDVPGLIVHAEICEDFWVPVPPSSGAALAGATVLLNLSASNITIGKAETRRECCASRNPRAAWPPICMPRPVPANPPPIWRGTARRASSRTAWRWRRPSGFRCRRRWPWRMSIWGCCGRSACGSAASTTTAATIRRWVGPCSVGIGGGSQCSSNRRTTIAGCCGGSSGFRSCRRMRRGWSWIATRRTTSRFPAWRSGCRRLAASAS